MGMSGSPLGSPSPGLFNNGVMNPIRSQHVRGFTMIELMMVVAVIAILALLALPSIRDRLVRQQVIEAMPLVDFAKGAVAAHYAASGVFPADNAQAGVPPADRIVSSRISSVVVNQGALVLTFGNQAMGGLTGLKLSMRPAYVAGYPQVPVAWLCGAAPVPAQMQVSGNNDTTVPAKFLPLACRSR
ncbi:MAG: hypothetical protein RLZZ618_486 [Pseudomonadota bacterium]|jgi:type IV pilus assembly protein PilA